MSRRFVPIALFTALLVLPVTGGHAEEASDDRGGPPAGALWALALASDSKGSGHVADVDGDGRLEIVFGTYFGDAHLYCVNAEDGSVAWKQPSEGGPFDASVAIADLDGDEKPDILAADSASGQLYCLDGAGAVQWTLRLPSGTDSPPAIGDLDGDGKPELVIGTMWRRGGDGCVCAIDPRERTILWQAAVKGCVQSEAALVDLDADGHLDVVVTSWRGDRGIHAFRGHDGEKLFTFVTDGDERSVGMYHGVSVVESEDGPILLTATCAGDVLALDAKGKLLWKQHVDDYLFAPTTLADVDGDGTPELFVAGRKARLYEVADGELVWERDLESFIARGAAAVDVTDDRVPELVLSAGKTAYVLDGATGKTLQSFGVALDPSDQGERVSAAPLVADFDGDGRLDLFVVSGRGTSGKDRPPNQGHALALPLGKGAGAWTTFRGGLRRVGRAER